MEAEFDEDGWGRHRAGDEEVSGFRSPAAAFNLYTFLSNHFQNEQTDEPMENPQEVITECLSKFCTSDYIMEPGIFTQLKR